MTAAAIALGWAPLAQCNNVDSVLRRRTPEHRLLSALRQGDERAFAEFVDLHHQALVRVAKTYVRDQAVAEEVAQETWLIVLRGLEDFQERSSLKTWIFSILINRAKTRGARESRQVPASTLSDDEGSAVAPGRFLPADHADHPHQWARPPEPWPEERLLARETIELIRAAVATLPTAQQVVLGLRDVEGWSAREVCQALDISAANERVLLHRARARLRRLLENYFEASP